MTKIIELLKDDGTRLNLTPSQNPDGITCFEDGKTYFLICFEQNHIINYRSPGGYGGDLTNWAMKE